ncbi:alpha/beta fold hydrolase [Mariluticola halotolerans]|uniref:alpha/beta fold hydrolase n=1 Tax=Mariluticola halotolerans TaxID=2909283 RepID=UPI0026E32D70|nr:alpha/beta hydrolase [Mariluticola halotolerans]UJQ95344.1 alpha/beta hydrolase [Mariluticola halotolerans]
MPKFTSEGFEIAYETYGEGPPVVLVHGFASSGQVNWVATGWVETLTEAGYQAITIDNRGHGQSEKIYDSEYYSAREMAKDTINLIDHLGIGPAVLLGYSMGARISAFAALDAPEKVRAVIFGGLGINMIHGMSNSEEIIEGLLSPALSSVTHKTARQFRIFADHTRSDRKALAACMAGSRARISADDVKKISVPALVAVGSEDDVGGAPEPLAELLPQGEVLVIERRDHMRATGDPQFKTGVLAFLQRHP